MPGTTAGCKYLLYWMAVPLRQHVEVWGPRAEAPTPHFRVLGNLIKEVFAKDNIRGMVITKVLYRRFTDTPQQSRMEELGFLSIRTVCRRYLALGDPKLEEQYFQMATNKLPTKARFNYINPRRWEDPVCTWNSTSKHQPYLYRVQSGARGLGLADKQNQKIRSRLSNLGR